MPIKMTSILTFLMGVLKPSAMSDFWSSDDSHGVAGVMCLLRGSGLSGLIYT